MACTTLGKRRRGDCNATFSLSSEPSCKKRALRSSINDENASPNPDEHARDDATYDNEFELTELDDPFTVSREASRRRSIAVEWTTRDSYVETAPVRNNGQLKSVKATPRMPLVPLKLNPTNLMKAIIFRTCNS